MVGPKSMSSRLIGCLESSAVSRGSCRLGPFGNRTPLLPGEKPIESGSPVRVALLEDYPPLRDSIQQLVSAHARYRWLGGWGTLPKLLHGLAAEPADVVLMDLQLGAAMDGIGATAEVRRRFPRTAVLVLTLFDQPEFVFKALRAGAVGYMLKSSTPSEILAAIEEVAGARFAGPVRRSR